MTVRRIYDRLATEDAKDGPALGVGAGHWWKCTQALKDGRGPDIVRSWPSCTAWQLREEKP